MLDNLDGTGKASCTAQGFIPTTASLLAAANDSTDCVPGCPSGSGTAVTNSRRVTFKGSQAQRTLKMPTNKNGKAFLKQHGSIQMGLCVEVTDHEGHVRREECRALVQPSRRKKH
jgi:hypothetical protein